MQATRTAVAKLLEPYAPMWARRYLKNGTSAYNVRHPLDSQHRAIECPTVCIVGEARKLTPLSYRDELKVWYNHSGQTDWNFYNCKECDDFSVCYPNEITDVTRMLSITEQFVKHLQEKHNA